MTSSVIYKAGRNFSKLSKWKTSFNHYTKDSMRSDITKSLSYEDLAATEDTVKECQEKVLRDV